jgi:hypothetical protein
MSQESQESLTSVCEQLERDIRTMPSNATEAVAVCVGYQNDEESVSILSTP